MISAKTWIDGWKILGHSVDCPCRRCKEGIETFLLVEDIEMVQKDIAGDCSFYANVQDIRIADLEAQLKEARAQIEKMRSCFNCEHEERCMIDGDIGCDNNLIAWKMKGGKE